MNFVPHTPQEIKAMLQAIGLESTEDLFSDIPENLKLQRELDLPKGLDEMTLRREVTSLSQENIHTEDYINFLGAGAYDHYRPSIINHLISRSEFYTAYTPYQPEISQGTLQSIFEFQTAICELTGMDVANASMYDGATALAEGMIMAVAQTNKKKVLLSSTVHPEYREVIKTYAWAREIEIIEIPYTKEGSTDLDFLDQTLTNDFAAVIIQNPNFFGKIEKLKTLIDRVKSTKALSIVCADPISLGILEAPGKLGVDIVVGEGQSLGMPLSFGGPYLGFIATTEKLIRRIPGRIVGLAKDQHGKDGFVLTLQAREQHIRREKASSNICSNQALCALTAIIYLSALGKKGLKEVAEHCISKAHYAQKVLTQIDGVELAFPQGPSFKEFVVKTKEDIACINDRLFQAGILGGLDLGRFYPELKNHMLICVTEARSKTEIDLLKQVWEGLA